MSYVIRNCPNLSYAIMADGTERNFQCGLEIDEYCQDCTDCVMKQIVELAKGYKEELIDRKTKKVVATRYFKLTKEILKLLDIEEIK